MAGRLWLLRMYVATLRFMLKRFAFELKRNGNMFAFELKQNGRLQHLAQRGIGLVRFGGLNFIV